MMRHGDPWDERKRPALYVLPCSSSWIISPLLVPLATIRPGGTSKEIGTRRSEKVYRHCGFSSAAFAPANHLFPSAGTDDERHMKYI